MEPARRLRDRLQTRELTTGLLVSDHLWPDLVEISVRAGMDYLIVDMEHGCANPDTIAEVCATGRRMGFPILLRPRSNDYATMRLAVDLGPCGFLLACVESAADLDTVRDAICLPPRGRRRPGGRGNRWVPDTLASTWKTVFERQFVVLPQIETKVGLENLDAIAAHEMTTAMAIGPYDLSVELGVGGQMDAQPLQQALKQIRAVGEKVGKSCWMIGSGTAEMARDGWRFLCFGEPTWILEGALRERVAQTRQAMGG
jgi:2-keto-3-deoxy-L-rhamnonate aldolase RhmA